VDIDYIELMEANRGTPLSAYDAGVLGMSLEDQQDQDKLSKVEAAREEQRRLDLTAMYQHGVTFNQRSEAITRVSEDTWTVEDLTRQLERAKARLRSSQGDLEEIDRRLNAALAQARNASPENMVVLSPPASRSGMSMLPVRRYLEERHEERVARRMKAMQDEAFARVKDAQGAPPNLTPDPAFHGQGTISR